MRGNVYGYVRVSCKDQNESRQIIALQDEQVKPENIFLDKQSGKDFERPAYKRLLRCLKQGDLLIVKSIDRLGRNYSEILEQWRIITKEKKSDIKVLDMELLNTSMKSDLTGTLIADIVLQLLSYVAQTERENLKQRQEEGIRAAKARGVQFGRPKMTPSDNFEQVYRAWQNKEISSRQAAAMLKISQTTFLTWGKKMSKNDKK